MKWNQSIVMLALSALMFVGCKNAEGNTDVTSTQSDNDAPEMLATASFTIEGMHCEHGCAGNIKKKLAKMEGVKEVEIDFEGKKATIVYDTNKQSPEAFVEKVLSIDKTYVVSDVVTSSDKAFWGGKEKDKKKTKNKAADSSKSSGSDEVPAKSCDSEKKAACCSKKAATS
ncbi:MAG: heavy-metal-associated domain-containing protein [Flavobacterium sp.]